MGNLWENLGEIYGKSRGNLGEIYGKWEIYGKSRGNLWENLGEIYGKREI